MKLAKALDDNVILEYENEGMPLEDLAVFIWEQYQGLRPDLFSPGPTKDLKDIY